MSPSKHDILIVSDDEAEGILLKELCLHSQMPCTRACVETIEQASIQVGTLRRDERPEVVLIDSRICEHPAFLEVLAPAFESAFKTLIVYYSSYLDTPAIDSIIRETKTVAVCIDKTRSGWPRELLKVIDDHFRKLLFWNALDSLAIEQPMEYFPVAPSVSSELLFIKELVRESPLILADRNISLAIRTIIPGACGPIQAAEEHFREPVKHFTGFVEVLTLAMPDRPLMNNLGLVISQAFNEICDLRDSNQRTAIRAWLLRCSLPQVGLRRLYSDMPFLDPREGPLTLAFDRNLLNDSFHSPWFTAAIYHEMAHVSNRLEKPLVGSSWIWFDEAIANWLAVEITGYEVPKVAVPPEVGLDRFSNRYAGLYFLRFLERVIGRSAIFQVWRQIELDVFAALDALSFAASELILKFFIWAFDNELLTYDLSKSRIMELSPCSYLMLPIDDRVLRISAWAANGWIVLLARTRFPHAMKLPVSEFEVTSNQGWENVLLINTTPPRAGGSSQILIMLLSFLRLG